jgi:hypothetical protein
MAKLDAITKRLMGCCLAWRWDWMVVLLLPGAASASERDGWFRQWIGEIEQADGTLGFRWIRFIPKKSRSDKHEFFVLVGGLSSAEWWFWTKRWSEIVGDPEARGAFEYSYRQNGNRLRSIVNSVLDDQKFDVEVRLGPMTIRRSRTMKVDEDGMPRNGGK